ncbi:hypothetical protein TNCT_208981 [Trichonephila clavata]|uniref:Uncharacterized protein n=1 Tax=Trichonephila clavata TaxID=2740835 RepID=A0A8X6JBX1_TRICU|nr:hypothetical protein TNCT_208981 [Trichonephila clavata]
MRFSPSSGLDIQRLQQWPTSTKWAAGTKSNQLFCRLFTKILGGDKEIDHKPGFGRPVRCNVDHLRQKVEARLASMVRQLGAELSVAPQTISRHLAAMSVVGKFETWVPCLTMEQRQRRLETSKALQECEIRERFCIVF